MVPTEKLRQAVSAYKNGDAQAFTLLYQESDKYIYTCIYKVIQGNDNAADMISDIMQVTYVEISKSIRQLENEDCFLQWAGMIVTRKCYAYLKKSKKYILLDEEDGTFENLSDTDMIIPENVMQDREKQRLVREIIDTSLTEMQKLCIIAYYFQEQKQSEIAKELGIPENTVKTNLSRAKQKIRDGVLDLEKNEGTRLYSVAPLLLLLFKEDVKEAAVPDAVSAKVGTAILETGVRRMAGTAVGKFASISGKAKITLGIIALGAAAAVGGTIYAVVNRNSDPELTQAEETQKESQAPMKENGDQDITMTAEKPETETMEKETSETETTEKLETETSEVEDAEREDNQKVTYRDILSDTSSYMEYYPSDTDFNSICFTIADIDGDGKNELLIGDQYREYDEQPFRIINVLTEKDGEILDYDGDHTYENISEFVLYSNGILESYLWDGWNKTCLWDLTTGESWEGAKYKPVEGSLDLPADERETHAYLTDQNGTVYEGQAGDEEYQTLTQGETIPLIWYQVTEENMTAVLE